jgi:hypothetical protein
MYLLAQVAFRYRNIRSVNKQRLLVALLLVAVIPIADRPDALATLFAVTHSYGR